MLEQSRLHVRTHRAACLICVISTSAILLVADFRQKRHEALQRWQRQRPLGEELVRQEKPVP